MNTTIKLLFSALLLACTALPTSAQAPAPSYSYKVIPGKQGSPRFKVSPSPHLAKDFLFINVEPKPSSTVEVELLKANYTFASHINLLNNSNVIGISNYTDSVYHMKVTIDGIDYLFDLLRQPDKNKGNGNKAGTPGKTGSQGQAKPKPNPTSKPVPSKEPENIIPVQRVGPPENFK